MSGSIQAGEAGLRSRDQLRLRRPPPLVALPGLLGVLLALVVAGLLVWLVQLPTGTKDVVYGAPSFGLDGLGGPSLGRMLLQGALAALLLLILGGFMTISTGQAVNLQVFGRYVGTLERPGLNWRFPFFVTVRRLSTLLQTTSVQSIKVNDQGGSPVEIGGVAVWRVVDPARAQFAVEQVWQFVAMQLEAALRDTASRYPYDIEDDHRTEPHEAISLRGDIPRVAEVLREELQERCARAGADVQEFRITHLAYAPEIASAMLRRQQAQAILSARRRIVEGAVGMAQDAIAQIETGDPGRERPGVALDEGRKAALIQNLLVVMVGEAGAQPVINAGASQP